MSEPPAPPAPSHAPSHAQSAPAPLCGIVLAGGAGRRMGGTDKAFLTLAGRPLIAHVIGRLGCACAISANGDPVRFAAFGLPVLADPMPGLPGPLAGVLAGLDFAASQGAAGIATAATDTPFFPPDCAQRLARGAADAGAPAALASGMTAEGMRPHPTFAWWAITLREPLRRFLADGGRKVGAFAAAVGAVEVPFAGDEPFFNINTPQDLARAAQRLVDAPSAP